MMKKKIIGFVLCLFVFLSTIVPAASIINKYEIKTISNSVEVPIWKVGNKWTYNYIESRTWDPAYEFTGELTFKVVDDSDYSYVLKASTRPRGAFDLGSINIGLKTTLFSKMTMELQLRKTDLGLESFVEEIKGIWKLKIGSVTLPIPIQILGRYNVEFEPTWTIMPFPLYDGKYGDISDVEILHINDTLHLFWGLILAYGPLTEAIPIGPLSYTCSEEEITVNDRKFNVYNVSAVWMEGSKIVSYYSEETGNIVKIVIQLLTAGKNTIYSNILEIKDWSYTP